MKNIKIGHVFGQPLAEPSPIYVLAECIVDK